jgi:hypothetical protein
MSFDLGLESYDELISRAQILAIVLYDETRALAVRHLRDELRRAAEPSISMMLLEALPLAEIGEEIK